MTSSTKSADDAKWIINGGPEPTNILEGARSLGELCFNRFTRQGSKIILIDARTKEEVSALQLRDRSLKVAECLTNQLNIKSTDVIGICAENCLEFAYVLFGTIFAGATLSPMNASYTDRELNHAVSLSKPKIIFAARNTVANVRKVGEQNKCVQKIIGFNNSKTFKYPDGIVDFNDLLATSESKGRLFRIEPQNIADKVALILYSSGTTGQPKGVELTQKNVIMGIAQHFARERKMEDKLVPNPRILSIIPWFHTFGCHVLIGSTINNYVLIYLPKFEDRTFLGGIQNYKANTTYLVPPLMVFLSKNAIVDEYDLSSLKIIWCGAAPLSKELEDNVRQRLNVPLVRQAYGMTEGTIGFTSQSDNNHKPGSVGILNAGLRCRIVDVETGQTVGPRQRGELQFQGATTMKGYIGDVAATRATIDSDGWLHTGDIGFYDNDGEIFIVDRLKELIKYNGFQVPPAEIEGLLLRHPDVSDAGVIGVPDERSGELPLAFVVRQDGSSVTEKEIVDFVAGLTSHAKRLHGGVRFVEEIPKNPSGKILRRELRQLLNIVTKSKL